MLGVTDFNPDTDIPSLAGKVIFITEGTAGLDRESVLALAKHDPAHIFFTGRNTEAAQALINEVQNQDSGNSGNARVPATTAVPGITFLKPDMTSLATVKAIAAKFAHDRLDLLICNTGIMVNPPAVSKDCFNLQFFVNYFAHALLIRTLFPVLQRTAAAIVNPPNDMRIVNLTSTG
ncbi:NAD(P)-binding domain protein [Niveomyces insectorum RCEF 264]|uniref:NAD(P)-binding domain protein n=1 Tax=Niveomyces insectorum RCEF 264 TaxID=1081102 RepID=A0A162MLE2_9HYPO|nr:NAD(P)-binding domain protein [Niveomyces insectorum RCEF 264]